MRVSPGALRSYVVDAASCGALPLDWSARFGRTAPLGVELGFGNGEYLAWWAEQEPAWNLVGFEKPLESLARASRLLDRAARQHVRLVRGDARYLLRELFPPASVDRVIMQFPMPWPKDRHAKHRVSGPRFAATLAHVLAPGASFELVTDQDWFAGEVKDSLDALGCFRLSPTVADPARPFRTRYERRWLAEGRRIHRFGAELTEHRPAETVSLAAAMTTVPLSSMPGSAELRGVQGRRFRSGSEIAEVKEVFLGERDALLKVVSSDDGFSQLFFLRVVARPDGSGLLKVEEHPRPYHTRAVRFLVLQVGAALGSALAAS